MLRGRFICVMNDGPYTLLNGRFLANVYVHVRYMSSSVRPSVVCLSSVTFVRSTQAIEMQTIAASVDASPTSSVAVPDDSVRTVISL